MANSGKLYKQSSSPSLYLEPNGSGEINVLENFSWNESPKAARKEVVPAILTEFQPNNSQLLNAIYYLSYQMFVLGNFSIGASTVFSPTASNSDKMDAATTIFKANSDAASYYYARYVASATGFKYIFPYMGDQKFMRDNTFAVDDLSQNFSAFTSLWNASKTWALADFRGKTDEFGAMIQWVDAVFGLAKSTLNGRIGTINTSSWRDTAPETISLAFELSNTGTLDDVSKNTELCYILHYQNTPVQRNVVLTQGGCIYSLYIPDVVYMPVCYMKNYKVDNLGQTKFINGRTIPEGYRLTMNFESIVTPMTRNLLNYVNGNNVDLSLPNLGLPNVITSTETRDNEVVPKVGKLIDTVIDTVMKPADATFNFLNSTLTP